MAYIYTLISSFSCGRSQADGTTSDGMSVANTSTQTTTLKPTKTTNAVGNGNGYVFAIASHKG